MDDPIFALPCMHALQVLHEEVEFISLLLDSEFSVWVASADGM